MAHASDAKPPVADEEGVNANSNESDDGSSDDEERVPTPEGDIPEGIDKEVWKELKRVDNFRRTALHRLAEKGSGDTVTMLVTTFGADVNAGDCMGQTPIHYALRFNNKSFMAALANCGANLEQKDLFGTTPVAAARDDSVRAFIQGLIDEQPRKPSDARAPANASATSSAESKEVGAAGSPAAEAGTSSAPGATSASSTGMEGANDAAVDEELAENSSDQGTSENSPRALESPSEAAADEAEAPVGLSVSPITTSSDAADTGSDGKSPSTSPMGSGAGDAAGADATAGAQAANPPSSST